MNLKRGDQPDTTTTNGRRARTRPVGFAYSMSGKWACLERLECGAASRRQSVIAPLEGGDGWLHKGARWGCEAGFIDGSRAQDVVYSYTQLAQNRAAKMGGIAHLTPNARACQQFCYNFVTNFWNIPQKSYSGLDKSTKPAYGRATGTPDRVSKAGVKRERRAILPAALVMTQPSAPGCSGSMARHRRPAPRTHLPPAPSSGHPE